MKCPSCSTPLELQARFCGVCGYQLPLRSNVPAAGSGSRPPTASPSDDPYIGTMLNNRFKVEAKLGEGGFGAVYRGIQQPIGRVVALKLLHPEMTRDDNLVARFRREGQVMCGLNDAHTITTYDFDQTPDGTLYIAMELLEGRSLHDVFADEAPIAWQRMFKIASQMCTSLSEAHSKGIVHRDLKPENIHLENRPGNPEFVKVLDFGIAKVMQGDGIGTKSPQLTATGQTLGTLEYMSPEQLMGKQLDGRSDVYAMGVVCYELITGRLPFPNAKGPAGLITAQLREVPDNPSAANPAGNVPSGVDQIILKCLAKDKKNRFATVDELRTAIEEVLRTGGVWTAGQAAASGPRPAAPGPAVPPAAAPRPAPAHAHAPLPAQPSPRQPTPPPIVDPASTAAALRASRNDSRFWLWVIVGIVVVGGGVIGAVLALQ